MSGTSADGVDVALTRISGRGMEMQVELLRHHERPYPPRLTAAIAGMRNRGETQLSELAEVGHLVSLVYAIAVNELLVASATPCEHVACVAAHGQTLFHAPPLTIQWLDPALLAARTGCRVVSDFRRADCALGGQGAPLVPLADYILFRDQRRGRMLVNIGGIANVTWLPAGGRIEEVTAFDTGPGNCISDWLMQKRGTAAYDKGGAIAAGGRCIPDLVSAVLAQPYFQQQPPKSTDGPAMVAAFEAEMQRLSLMQAPLADLLASAADITAGALLSVVKWVAEAAGAEWVVAGGGVKNAAIRAALQRRLGQEVSTTESLGMPAQAREAAAFAVLGAATLDEMRGSLPRVTGAQRGAVLGSITPVP